MPSGCAACSSISGGDFSLFFLLKVVGEQFFLLLLGQSGQCCGKVAVSQYGGLSAGGKVIFSVRLQPGKLDKLLVCQIVKGNFPSPFLLQPYDFPYCSTPNDSSAKGVMPASDILLIGFNLGHGNSPFLDNRMGRQHFLLSPLVCLPAKTDGAVNGGRSPFISTVDWLGWVCYLSCNFKLNQKHLTYTSICHHIRP